MRLFQHDEILLQAPKIWVGLSGGIDSTVLLHALFSTPELAHKLYPVHVNHQIQSAASDFEKICRELCEQLELNLNILYLEKNRQPGESIEAYAREGRYELLKTCLEPGDVLVTAHHLEDQVETFLIQLARGAGVEGLSSMPVLSELGLGYLYRPWLREITKQDLKNYAMLNNLSWIEDPMNAEPELERNFWRHMILPKLAERHCGVFKTISRSARHCAEAAELLEILAEKILKEIGGKLEAPLPWDKLKNKKMSEQKLVLRYWLKSFDLVLSQVQLENLIKNKRLNFEGIKTEIRLFQEKFYVVNVKKISVESAENWEIVWNGEGELILPDGAQPRILTKALLKQRGVPVELIDWSKVSFRNRKKNQAERVLLLGAEHHRSLKNIFQEYGIPPWMRDQTPLICIGGEIIAVVR